MRLYTLTKRQFVLVFVGFFACFVVTFIIGLAGLFNLYFFLVSAEPFLINHNPTFDAKCGRCSLQANKNSDHGN